MKLRRVLPVGMEPRPVLTWVGVGLLLGLCFNLFFLFTYGDAHIGLFSWVNDTWVLNGTSMPPFSTLLSYTPYGCLVALLSTLPLGWYLYSYHFRESKSIYTMRRLPNRWELWRRCLTIPISAALLYLLEFLLILLLDFAIYWLLTPAPCLPPFSWGQLFGL